MAGTSIAIVRPRVISPHTGEVLLLQDVVAEHLAEGACGVVEVSGEPLTGKTTAIEYLAQRFAEEANLTLVDGEARFQHHFAHDRGITVATAAPEAGGATLLARYQLAPWGRDESIEYLLAAHKSRCSEVMSRLVAAKQSSFGGNACLWRLVLDELAANDEISSAEEALRLVLDQLFSTCDSREALRNFALVATARMAGNSDELDQATRVLANQRMDRLHWRMLALEPIRIFLAAEKLVLHLREAGAPADLRRTFSYALIQEVALSVRGDEALRMRLGDIVTGDDRTLHAMAASILHAADKSWQPMRMPSTTDDNPLDSLPDLSNAIFVNADWPGIDLREACLTRAQLPNANLEGACLDGAHAEFASFAGATLRGASLDNLAAARADFSRADQTSVNASHATFQGDLAGANFEVAHLLDVTFDGANLTGTRFARANLSRASFLEADITGADFTEANLERSYLTGLDLRLACFDQSVFTRATLRECNLEGMQLSGANFEGANLEGALLTNTVMSQGRFRGANLRGAGLADIEWEGVDLRYADLRYASFHLGSTRCGLVGSPYPSHGTRTGFYTDDYNEQDFKAPEEIRKANLCGADLRGANIAGVDFYLVDLRNARYDAQQMVHLRQCGAILRARAH